MLNGGEATSPYWIFLSKCSSIGAGILPLFISGDVNIIYTQTQIAKIGSLLLDISVNDVIMFEMMGFGSLT